MALEIYDPFRSWVIETSEGSKKVELTTCQMGWVHKNVPISDKIQAK
jgi:hypothetical protein